MRREATVWSAAGPSLKCEISGTRLRFRLAQKSAPNDAHDEGVSWGTHFRVTIGQALDVGGANLRRGLPIDSTPRRG